MFRKFLTVILFLLPFGTATAETIARPQARPPHLELYGTTPTTLENQNSATCIAVAIYHEARGESVFGQRAVASVVLQRSHVIGRWGDNACAVIVPVQFSFMNENGSFDAITDIEAWSKALVTAKAVMSLGPLPHMKQADHYHTQGVSPSWRHSMVVVRQIGEHIFYRDPTSRS